MEVEQVREMRDALEIQMINAMHSLIDDFQEKSGVQITCLDVSLLEVVSVRGSSKSCVSGLKVSLEI